jgi:hypothetical protein
MLKDLIIIGGNRSYYAEVQHLVTSLRVKGGFSGDIVVCDNATRRTRWGGLRLDTSVRFSQEQQTTLSRDAVEVLQMEDLARQAGLNMRRVLRIHTEHHCHPLKFVYCALISRLKSERYQRIAFCDGDVCCQGPFDLEFVQDNRVHVAAEGCLIGATKYMSAWMEQIALGSQAQQVSYADFIGGQENFCAGFFAGTSETFTATAEYIWNLSEVAALRFHNDQPILNYAIHWLKLPYTEIPWPKVCHLANVSSEDLRLDEEHQEVWVRGEKPALVHYHGPHRRGVKALLGLG